MIVVPNPEALYQGLKLKVIDPITGLEIEGPVDLETLTRERRRAMDRLVREGALVPQQSVPAADKPRQAPKKTS